MDIEPRPSATQEIRGPGASYTFSQTLRACLRALQFAAWLEAMVLAHRAVQPQGPGAWSWFLVRCFLFSLGAYVTVGVLAQIMRRRDARSWGAMKRTREETAPEPSTASDGFDVHAFENTASALLFHFGTPLWMWIFA
jgi:hypothetical protein